MLPPFTQALIVANAVVFLLELTLGGTMLRWFALWPGYGGGLAVLPWTAPWQLVSYSFLHASIMHLAFNMLGVWMFGADLERVWGPKRFAILYFASVVSAALAQLLIAGLFGGSRAPVLGASGGVFGLLLAYAAMFPNRTVVLLFPPIPMRARTFALVYGLLELILGVTGLQVGVAHFAHLGGMVGSYLAMQYFRGRPPFGRR
ncbi:MAG TPA: rhomboid family intramembrane serine protease [Burkholderiales bacterium]|nr:rhomboid family intramembrane serine protease [Burkholderiales bacterium]